MATVKKTIGRLPVYKGDWVAGTYSMLNQVSYLGSTFQSKIDNNTSQPATLVDNVLQVNSNWSVISNGTAAYLADSRLSAVENTKANQSEVDKIDDSIYYQSSNNLRIFTSIKSNLEILNNKDDYKLGFSIELYVRSGNSALVNSLNADSKSGVLIYPNYTQWKISIYDAEGVLREFVRSGIFGHMLFSYNRLTNYVTVKLDGVLLLSVKVADNYDFGFKNLSHVLNAYFLRVYNTPIEFDLYRKSLCRLDKLDYRIRTGDHIKRAVFSDKGKVTFGGNFNTGLDELGSGLAFIGVNNKIGMYVFNINNTSTNAYIDKGGLLLSSGALLSEAYCISSNGEIIKPVNGKLMLPQGRIRIVNFSNQTQQSIEKIYNDEGINTFDGNIEYTEMACIDNINAKTYPYNVYGLMDTTGFSILEEPAIMLSDSSSAEPAGIMRMTTTGDMLVSVHNGSSLVWKKITP